MEIKPKKNMGYCCFQGSLYKRSGSEQPIGRGKHGSDIIVTVSRDVEKAHTKGQHEKRKKAAARNAGQGLP